MLTAGMGRQLSSIKQTACITKSVPLSANSCPAAISCNIPQKGRSLMSIQDLGSIGEFIGSIGVVASLIYLAIQIRLDSQQTAIQTKAIHATAFQNLIDHHTNLQMNMIINPELREAVRRARSDPTELSAEERMLYGMFATQQVRSFYNAYHLYESGLINDDQWRTLEGNIARVARGKTFGEFWESAKSDYPAAFQEEIAKRNQTS